MPNLPSRPIGDPVPSQAGLDGIPQHWLHPTRRRVRPSHTADARTPTRPRRFVVSTVLQPHDEYKTRDLLNEYYLVYSDDTVTSDNQLLALSKSVRSRLNKGCTSRKDLHPRFRNRKSNLPANYSVIST